MGQHLKQKVYNSIFQPLVLHLDIKIHNDNVETAWCRPKYILSYNLSYYH